MSLLLHFNGKELTILAALHYVKFSSEFYGLLVHNDTLSLRLIAFIVLNTFKHLLHFFLQLLLDYRVIM